MTDDADQGDCLPDGRVPGPLPAWQFAAGRPDRGQTGGVLPVLGVAPPRSAPGPAATPPVPARVPMPMRPLAYAAPTVAAGKPFLPGADTTLTVRLIDPLPVRQPPVAARLTGPHPLAARARAMSPALARPAGGDASPGLLRPGGQPALEVAPTAIPAVTATRPPMAPIRYPEVTPGPKPPAALSSPTPTRGWTAILRRAARWALVLFTAWIALLCALIVVYRYVDPPVSSLMVQRSLAGEEIRQMWVPIEIISPNAVRAVLVSEDSRFCVHNGVDFVEIQNAIERGGDGPPRGASTISMQVIKNLFLWPSKSYVRKAIEIPLTYLMELIWPKRRIMEVYLNIAEWGPGIFGIEAASWHYFKKASARLTPREAARLAVALPNPFTRNAGAPGPGMQRLATIIQGRMRHVGRAGLACVLDVQNP